MRTAEFPDGIVIHADWSAEPVQGALRALGPFPLVVADPPYGGVVKESWDIEARAAGQHAYANTLLEWTRLAGELLHPGGALYIWGGTGSPGFRPFFEYLSRLDRECAPLALSTLVTWSKKRAYGTKHSYLYTREECAYVVNGDPKKPRLFNVPLLDQKRGYAGFNAKHPAKSEYLRRTNVWTDVTELFKGKMHPCEKPARLAEIMIETHTAPGETVLDPFAGSGSTAVAARKLGRRFVLVEKDLVTYEKIVGRLNA